ncbi:pilus assembly protein [Bordetella avium]|uniref:Type IV pilus assembly protein n=1 Tax=Bordetella avium (strain 197N) TaxID=360910 RepID=Q2KY61_BORA1|nr:pilus assembly protein [Bordetella avium]AZY49752.1 pilus assembly protein [Bordetella avium]RIQ17656.1 pilus assembly protein [Bordetella avium]RIQ32312.1 pilus assembly protein [Bordetella avium]RIQ50948.1 pilus assembly protein [Bordetella avium]RIQ68910.1 pilus assembly protein [Bordetella avium]
MADTILKAAKGGGRWVYGMAWFAVVGSHAPRMARLRARQMGASHYLLGGEQALTVGCSRLRGRGVFHSAAQQVASHFAPASFAAILALDDSHWLVAVQEGAVLSGGDQLFARYADAEAALDRLGPDFTGNSEDAEQALQALPGKATRLHALPPRPSGWLVLAVLTAGLGLWLWPTAQAPAPLAQTEKPAELCLADVLASLQKIPMRQAGWLLAEAQCQAGLRSWSCHARYQPETSSALSSAFRTDGPWTLALSGMDDIALSWQAPGQCEVSLSGQPPDLRWMQAMQPWRGAFDEIHMGPWMPKDEVQARALRLSGPLRSYSLPPWRRLPAYWRRVQLHVDLSRPPSARSSGLTLLVEGDLHAVIP